MSFAPDCDRQCYITEHLARIPISVFFLMSTRDDLSDLSLLRPVVDRLGDKATLHLLETADRWLQNPKRTYPSTIMP